MLRVHTQADNTTTPHPLHSLLEPNGGGEGEEEESVMWFAVTHEKSENEEEEPWLNESWRSKWMERMEPRDYLPGPPTTRCLVSEQKAAEDGDPLSTVARRPPRGVHGQTVYVAAVNTWTKACFTVTTIAIGCRYFAKTSWNRGLERQSPHNRPPAVQDLPALPFSDSEDGRATSPDIAIPTKPRPGGGSGSLHFYVCCPCSDEEEDTGRTCPIPLAFALSHPRGREGTRTEGRHRRQAEGPQPRDQHEARVQAPRAGYDEIDRKEKEKAEENRERRKRD
ncbi:hypothetical protein B0H13DRAFT_2367247 [Mycena leptocephala]|nr:hypothetical protein B0H13DRAFT_2367247 [Mycena leptocephala]